MVEVNTSELKTAADELIEVLLPLAEDAKSLSAGTYLHPHQWGAIGSFTVARHYTPACEYQTKQASDFVDCLNGVYAGLLSVVVQYRKAELLSAEASQNTQKILDLRAQLKRDEDELNEARKKDQGLTD